MKHTYKQWRDHMEQKSTEVQVTQKSELVDNPLLFLFVCYKSEVWSDFLKYSRHLERTAHDKRNRFKAMLT